MKSLAFIKRSNGSHWVGDGFPVRSIFSYNDIAEALSPFLLMDYAGPSYFPPTTRKLGVGAHPHRASRRIELLGGLDAVQLHSLGNFVFDQRAPRASGAVLQISVFAQGTRALRLIAVPDVFELGRSGTAAVQ